jgi:hypothetical protein
LLKSATSKPRVTAELMEFSRLRSGLALVTMERDIFQPTDEDLSERSPAWEKRQLHCEKPAMKYAFIQHNKLVWPN